MADFLTGLELSAAIRHVLSGQRIRCAVAFWGDGAADLLSTCRPNSIQMARIVCDISMGNTSPTELKRLGAPDNRSLKFHDRLHSKVYISSAGAVVGSANASTNGIGFKDGKPAGLTEAGTLYSPDEPGWIKASAWFDELYNEAKPIDAEALARVWRNWSPPKGAGVDSAETRPGSLLDLVRSEPKIFAHVGFVFARNSNDDTSVEAAKKSVAASHPELEEDILNWSPNDMFTGWDQDELDRWPRTFFELWMPDGKLTVYARQIVHVDDRTQTVFSTRMWPQMRQKLGIRLPKAAEIGTADADLAARVLGSEEGLLFSSGGDLWKALTTLNPLT